MKTSAAIIVLACAFAVTEGFAPLATRAVGKKPAVATKPVAKAAPVKKVVKAAPAKVVAKAAPVKKAEPVKKVVVAKVAPKPVAKKVVPKPVAKVVVKAAAVRTAPASQGYPSFSRQSENWKPFAKISGGGNKAPPKYLTVPDFSNPALQIKRDPAFYAAAAADRKAKLAGSEFAFDDGLTELERKQRKTIPTFLTGSAKSAADKSTIRSDIVAEQFAFGLSADRFQLLFITVFGLFTLVGSLSGNLKL